MKNLIILTLIISVYSVYGQSSYTIQNNIETRPEIGISFGEATEQSTEIEIRNWSNGVYIVRVISEQDTKVLKLVKAITKII